jgi:hypothetical protein
MSHLVEDSHRHSEKDNSNRGNSNRDNSNHDNSNRDNLNRDNSNRDNSIHRVSKNTKKVFRKLMQSCNGMKDLGNKTACRNNVRSKCVQHLRTGKRHVATTASIRLDRVIRFGNFMPFFKMNQ